MGGSRATIYRVLSMVFVLFLGWVAEAVAQFPPVLVINRSSYTVCEGGTVQGTVTCTNCVFAGFDGFLQLTMTTGAATVAPLNMGPILNTPFSAPFTISGVTANAGDTLTIALYQGASLISFARSNVSVLPAGSCGPPIPCPVSFTLWDAPDGESTLKTIYRFRDKVMTRSRAGRRYIKDFKRHSWEGTWLLCCSNPELRDQALDVLARIQPTLQAVVDRQPASLSTNDLAAVESLMMAFESNASPELRKTLIRLRRDLRSGKLLSRFGVGLDASP